MGIGLPLLELFPRTSPHSSEAGYGIEALSAATSRRRFLKR